MAFTIPPAPGVAEGGRSRRALRHSKPHTQAQHPLARLSSTVGGASQPQHYGHRRWVMLCCGVSCVLEGVWQHLQLLPSVGDNQKFLQRSNQEALQQENGKANRGIPTMGKRHEPSSQKKARRSFKCTLLSERSQL